jgi:type IV pilus assembly protein PilB
MGAETFLLASSMNCVGAQRVARKICEDCKEEYDPPAPVKDDIKKVLGNLVHSTVAKLSEEEAADVSELEGKKKLMLYRGKGCDKCGDSGYKGRIGIFEVLPVTDQVGKLILERSPSNEIEKTAIEQGMVTMKQDGYMKALEGVTTIEEVLRIAQE